jgi:hypothetical protein
MMPGLFPWPGGPGASGRGRVSGRISGASDSYPGTLSDDIVVLDRSRVVILDLTRARPAQEWREYYTAYAQEFTWPPATRLEVDQRGGWHAHLGSNPTGCRWSAWSLPEVYDMVTRATGGR